MMLLKDNIFLSFYNRYKVNKFLEDMRVEYKPKFIAYLIESGLYPAREEEGAPYFQDVLDYCLNLPYETVKEAFYKVYLIYQNEQFKRLNPPRPSDRINVVSANLPKSYAPLRMVVLSRAADSTEEIVLFEKNLDEGDFIPVDPRAEANLLIRYANLLIERQDKLEAEASGNL